MISPAARVRVRSQSTPSAATTVATRARGGDSSKAAPRGRVVLVSSHDWGDFLQGYDRALLLDTSLLVDDRPDRVSKRLKRP